MEKTYTVYDILNAECNLEPMICLNCGGKELTFNQGIGDACCGDCGEWQLDIHKLEIRSLHDAHAECVCGWHYVGTGERTVKEIKQLYSNHLPK